jgi:hypothetical protein
LTAGVPSKMENAPTIQSKRSIADRADGAQLSGAMATFRLFNSTENSTWQDNREVSGR